VEGDLSRLLAGPPAGSARGWLEAARSQRSVGRAELASLASRWRDGVVPGVRVGLLAPDPVDLAALLVSLVAAGAVVVPLDPSAPEPARRELLGRAGAALVLTTGGTAGGAAGGALLPVGPGLAPPPGLADAGGGSDRPGGVLLFSSGSTGPRKAVLLEEGQLLHVARAVAAAHRLTPADRGLNPLPLFHVNAEVVAVLGSLVSGGELVLEDRFHRTGFADLVRRRRVTWVNAVPAILSILAAEPGDDPLPAAVRFVRSASAPLPVPVLERFERRWGVPVIETYGMTEAASQITANPLDARRPGSVGLPVAVELRVREGRVWIRGPGVIRAYAGGGGADRFDGDGWLDTGDVGRLDDDGYLYLSGRGGDAINRGGEKIFPREIEEVLRRSPKVRDAVVVPAPDPVLGEVPVAFVVPAAGAHEGPDADQLSADLRRLCDGELARSHRPAQLRVVASLPLGATGKVSRPALRQQLAAEHVAAQQLAAHQLAAEQEPAR
jgi:acyl-CoA synthetase (AMP-forming)/AMP-acid ligase II